MPIIDLNQLPAPDVVEELDFETILAERKATLISLYPEDQQEAVARTLTLESEPLVKLLEENAYRELLWRQRVNEAARAVMLACAAGNDLDVIGANYNTTRLTITPADDSTIPPTPAVMESDTDYRLRIQQAFEGLSVAGSVGAYQYHGRSADGRVADISVTSPSPACVTISVLSRENNGVASEDLLAVVRNALNGEDVRPVADRVTVQSAAIVEYQINATLLPLPWSRKRTHPRCCREKAGSVYHGTAPAGARHPSVCHLCRFACGRCAACRTGCTTGRHRAQQYAGVFLYRIPRRDRRLG